MTGGENSDHPLKPRRPKSREVSSRFLSPAGTPLHDGAASIPSPTHPLSTARRKPENRKNRILEESGSGGGGGASPEVDTLANHFEKERLKDLADQRNSNEIALFLNRQSRFENDKERAKENHRPSFDLSARQVSDKSRVPGKTSSNSSLFSSNLVPGRHSVDENVLYRKSASRRFSDVFRDNLDPESDNGSSKNPSFSSYLASTMSSRKSGKEVSSKYLNDRPRKGSYSDPSQPLSLDSSPKSKKFSIKEAMKRANSTSGSSQWALSPGRSGSPPHKGKLVAFSKLKPPSSPSRAKGMEKLWHMGVSLFKGNKFSSSSSAPPLSYLGARLVMNVDAVHQLRLLHNREMQWRFANARAGVVSEYIVSKTEINLVQTWDGIRQLQQSVLEKRTQLQKEKLKMKLNFILHSQMKLLETWGDVEMQHISAVSKTKDCLHSTIYKVPLIEGAKMNPQSTSIALRHASDLTLSIQSTLTFFSPIVEETVLSLAELAKVVAQEKLLLEECFELFKTISPLEIQERSLKCSVVQLKSLQKQHQLQQVEEITF